MAAWGFFRGVGATAALPQRVEPASEATAPTGSWSSNFKREILMKYARIEKGEVVELVDLEVADPKLYFTEELAATFVKAKDEVEQGWSYQNGKFAAPEETQTPPLDRQLVSAGIDQAAENARLKYITPGAGQALTYQEKAAELARYDETSQPRIADFPLLGAEIGITADSLTGVADAVRTALTLWRENGAAIERVRLQAKADVEKARDDEAIQEILDAIVWP